MASEERTAPTYSSLLTTAEDALRQAARGPLDRGAAAAFPAPAAARELLREFVHVAAAEDSEPTLDLVVVWNQGEGGESIRPRNVLLDLGRLLNAVATGTVTIAGAFSTPWLIPLAALIVWNDLYSKAKIRLTEHEAAVLWAFWLNRDHDSSIGETELRQSVDRLREEAEVPKLEDSEFQAAIENLEKIRCIQKKKSASKRWWLREWVSINYR